MADDRSALVSLLPHRAPFLFVDEVDACEPAVSVRARYRVTGAETDAKFERGFSVNPPADESKLDRLSKEDLDLNGVRFPHNDGTVPLDGDSD